MKYGKIMTNNAPQRLLGNITAKTLTQHLRELEEQGVISGRVFPEVPPKAEYSLIAGYR